jgi:hypothetical protein
MTPLSDIFSQYKINYHIYADDTQLYLSFDPKNGTQEAVQLIEDCISDVRCWMRANFLKLNDEKTELLVLSSKYLNFTVSAKCAGPSDISRKNGFGPHIFIILLVRLSGKYFI